jgi:hypothetical protein
VNSGQKNDEDGQKLNSCRRTNAHPPDDGAAEDIQESAEAALAATSQGI